MKFLGLQLFLTTTAVFTIATFANAVATKDAKASKGSKSTKGRDTECDLIPMIVSEPSQTDMYITPIGGTVDDDSESVRGGLWMWQDNFICPGDLGYCSGSTKVGLASGTCLTFADGECDSVDYLTFSDGSNLYMRGMDDDAVVIGGTKCFYGATGTVYQTYFEPTKVALEYWTYDLTNVIMGKKKPEKTLPPSFSLSPTTFAPTDY